METRHLFYWSLYLNVEVRIKQELSALDSSHHENHLNWLVLGHLGLNVEDLTQRTVRFFGPGSEYDTPINNPYREKGGRPTLF